MTRRTLGTTNLEVFPLCLGGNVFGWTIDEQQSFAVLDAYAAGGGNFVDTADAYGSWVPGNPPGASESIIGRWLAKRGNREDMIIATKVGMMPDRKGLSADNIARCAEESLKRLGTDHIDLYYAHADDPDVDLEETLSAFGDLIERGLVRHIAASNYSAPRLAEAIAVSQDGQLPTYVALQTHYNLMERGLYEGALGDVCARNDVACLPYYSLASGFLTAKYGDATGNEESPRAETARGYFNRGGADVLEVLTHTAQTHGVSPAAVALAWLAQQPTVSTPVASARNPEQLTDLMSMAGTTLSEDDLFRLNEVSPH